MKIFIKSAAAITPFRFTGTVSYSDLKTSHNERYSCNEPDYDKVLDPSITRRWSNILKMGMATALSALNEAGNPDIDAIITGTAYGYTEDTIRFLARMTNPEERGMNPTAFIQSTYNTISSLIALYLKNRSYNNTFVHSGFSFESALEDAILLLKSGEARNTLVGGVDELADDVFELLVRINKVRTRSQKMRGITQDGKANGFGEGSTFFVISENPLPGKTVEITNFTTLYSPMESDIRDYIKEISGENNFDIILTGETGQTHNDLSYSWLQTYPDKKRFAYKNLCGDYPTASGFALWLAFRMLTERPQGGKKEPETDNILIYNCFEGKYHSFICLKRS